MSTTQRAHKDQPPSATSPMGQPRFTPHASQTTQSTVGLSHPKVPQSASALTVESVLRSLLETEGISCCQALSQLGQRWPPSTKHSSSPSSGHPWEVAASPHATFPSSPSSPHTPTPSHLPCASGQISEYLTQKSATASHFLSTAFSSSPSPSK